MNRVEIQSGVWVQELPNKLGIALDFDGPLATLVLKPEGVVALVGYLEDILDREGT